MKKTLILAGLGLALAMSQANAASHIYNVSESFDGGTATGTVTTDALGSLGAANFTGWNLTVQRGADSSTLTPANSALDLGQLAPTITATLSSLTITVADEAALTAAGASNSLFFIANGGPTGVFYDLGSGLARGSFFSAEAIRLNSGNQAFAPNTTSVTFLAASSVPAPATLPLLAIGGAAMAWRRRKAA